MPSVVFLGSGPLIEDLKKLGFLTKELKLSDRLLKMGDSPVYRQNKWGQLLKLGLCLPDIIRAVRSIKECIRVPGSPGWIHSNGFKTHVLTALAAPKKMPIYWHIHDFIGQRPIMRKALNLVWRNGITAIAVSSAVAKDFSLCVPKCPLVTWQNTVDTLKFTAEGPEIANLDLLANLDSQWSGIRIGIVATYARWKGHDTFLRAASLLSNLALPVRFYIIGGPVYQSPGSQWTTEELNQLVRAYRLEGKVGFVPFQSETSPIYRALDIVVHASTKPEPFGLVIAEAMASRKPIVAVLEGGASEIGTDGVDCLGFKPDDHEGLADRLFKLVHDPMLRENLAVAGERKIKDHFSQDVIVPRWRDLIGRSFQIADSTS
jgi:glycosyltransferase involved in cell wall biosynthesis